MQFTLSSHSREYLQEIFFLIMLYLSDFLIILKNDSLIIEVHLQLELHSKLFTWRPFPVICCGFWVSRTSFPWPTNPWSRALEVLAIISVNTHFQLRYDPLNMRGRHNELRGYLSSLLWHIWKLISNIYRTVRMRSNQLLTTPKNKVVHRSSRGRSNM